MGHGSITACTSTFTGRDPDYEKGYGGEFKSLKYVHSAKDAWQRFCGVTPAKSITTKKCGQGLHENLKGTATVAI